ncbi:hypothetical protein [Alicyclobacillus fastidiosus]|uniref:hypothetical protein n=1 Tax=Alicyclobacillus fastidiosus TaxID=392011 RepID=UPI0034D72220
MADPPPVDPELLFELLPPAPVLVVPVDVLVCPVVGAVAVEVLVDPVELCTLVVDEETLLPDVCVAVLEVDEVIELVE